MSSKELKAAILEAGSVPSIWSVLQQFKAEGGEQHAAVEALTELRQNAASEAEEDVLLDALDYATGWCRPDMIIWNDVS